MSTALITGATGFLGAAIARTLVDRWDILALNRRRGSFAKQVVWDFHTDLPSDLPPKVDLIVHAAAATGRDVSDTDRECFRVNTQATAKLLQYAARAGTKHFVYISTGSVYALSTHPTRENAIVAPEGHYAATKAAAESLVAGYSGTFRTSCLRLFHPYGPDQRTHYLIPRLIARIQSGEKILLNGPEGSPTINPVFIDDAVEWIRRLIDTGAGGCFNLAGTESVSIRRLAERLAAMLGKPALFDVAPAVAGNRLGDIEQIIKFTGYTPSYDLDRGLRAVLSGRASFAA